MLTIEALKELEKWEDSHEATPAQKSQEIPIRLTSALARRIAGEFRPDPFLSAEPDQPLVPDTHNVSLCGKTYCANVLLCVPVDAKPEYLGEFVEFVKRLNARACAAKKEGKKRSDPEFLSCEHSKRFLEVLYRISTSSSWQIRVIPSKIHHDIGFDISIVLP